MLQFKLTFAFKHKECFYIESIVRTGDDNPSYLNSLLSQSPCPSCKSYFKSRVAPRMFLVIDTKKDDVVDFEEFLCAVAVFLLGSTEDKIKCKKESC